MDPLSISTAVITLLGASGSCARYIRQVIHNANHAPDEILSVSNEVADIIVLLQDLQSLLDRGVLLRNNDPPDASIESMYSQILRARAIIQKLRPVVDSVYSNASGGVARLNKTRWLRRRSMVAGLQQELVSVKHDINLSLTRFNVVTTTKIHLQLDQIIPQRVSSGSNGRCDAGGVEVSDSIIPSMQQDPQGSSIPFTFTDLPPQNHWSQLQWAVVQQIARFGNITFHLHRTVQCGGSCNCACHARRHAKSPAFLSRVVGHLFVGYAGLPLWLRHCTIPGCRNQYSRAMQVSYTFPSWLLSKAVDLTVAMTYTNEPHLGLKVRDRIPNSDNSIFNLARQGDLPGVSTLFEERRISPNVLNASTGQTPLYFAIEHPHGKDVANFLLDVVKIDPFIVDDAGWTVAHSVSRRVISKSRTDQLGYGSDEIFAKIATDHAEIWGFTHIHNLVVETHHGELESTLLKPHYREQVNETDTYGMTPLYWACVRGDTQKATILLAAGADETIRNWEGQTALHAAAEGGDAACVELLLRRGADVDHKDKNGCTALQTAAYSNDTIEIFDLLVNAGASVDTEDNYGTTALASAACLDHPRVARWLLERGADIERPDFVGCTPLYEAVRYCSDDVTKILLERGAALDFRVANGRSILHAIAISGTLKCMEIFLDAPLSILDAEWQDNTGSTARDLFKTRLPKPEGMQEAFLRLLDKIQQRKPDEEEEEEEEEEDNFFDANE